MERDEDFVVRLRAREAEVWLDILAAEPPGRPVGRRPRAPEKEAPLLEIDRERVAKSALLASTRRVPVEPLPDEDRPSDDPR
jgi:hypothetical protein